MGLQYLMNTQAADGSWPEPQTTGTGFPSVFYLRYDMYRNNWPLLALATYRNYVEGRITSRAGISASSELHRSYRSDTPYATNGVLSPPPSANTRLAPLACSPLLSPRFS
jgi:squalene-hopene/tetraprenyl-beta-curcumene cyclase